MFAGGDGAIDAGDLLKVSTDCNACNDGCEVGGGRSIGSSLVFFRIVMGACSMRLGRERCRRDGT